MSEPLTNELKQQIVEQEITQSLAPNTWHIIGAGSISVNVSQPTDKMLYIYATKTGSPGSLYTAGPAVFCT